MHHRLLMWAGLFTQCGEVQPAERAEQVAHELHLLAAEREIAAVGGLIEAIERRTTGSALVPRDRLPVLGERRPEEVRAAGERGVVHRHVQVVAFPGLLA